MLSEISQKERQILCDLTYNVEFKKPELIETENRLVVARDEGKRVKLVKGYKLNSYKINRLWGKMYSMVITVDNTVLHIWKFLGK